MIYNLVTDIQRTVIEEYVISVEASSLEEALDITYEHFSSFPNSDLDLKTRRRAKEETVTSNVLFIDHEHSVGSANDGPEVA